MNFSWITALLKGIKAAALAALAAGATVAIDYFFDAFSTPDQLAVFGVPALAVGIVLFVFATVKNWLKQHVPALKWL